MNEQENLEIKEDELENIKRELARIKDEMTLKQSNIEETQKTMPKAIKKQKVIPIKKPDFSRLLEKNIEKRKKMDVQKEIENKKALQIKKLNKDWKENTKSTFSKLDSDVKKKLLNSIRNLHDISDSNSYLWAPRNPFLPTKTELVKKYSLRSFTKGTFTENIRKNPMHVPIYYFQPQYSQINMNTSRSDKKSIYPDSSSFKKNTENKTLYSIDGAYISPEELEEAFNNHERLLTKESRFETKTDDCRYSNLKEWELKKSNLEYKTKRDAEKKQAAYLNKEKSLKYRMGYYSVTNQLKKKNAAKEKLNKNNFLVRSFQIKNFNFL